MSIVCKVHAPESSNYNFSVCVGTVGQRTWATVEYSLIDVRIVCAYGGRLGFSVELDTSFEIIK